MTRCIRIIAIAVIVAVFALIFLAAVKLQSLEIMGQ